MRLTLLLVTLAGVGAVLAFAGAVWLLDRTVAAVGEMAR